MSTEPNQPIGLGDLRKTTLLASWSAEEIARLIGTLNIQPFDAGERLMEEGEPGDEAWLLLSGEVDVVRAGPDGAPVPVARLKAGALLGEMALIDDDQVCRNASAVAHTAGRAMLISRIALRRVLAHDDTLARRLKEEREVQGTVAMIHRSPLASLVAGAETRTFASGKTLMREGDEPDGMYVLLTGHATVLKKIDGVLVRLADLMPGACVGELALLDDGRRTASVLAVTEVRALFVGRARFSTFIDGSPDAQTWFRTLRRFYDIPDRGLLSQHLTTLDRAVALRTTYDLPGERQVVCHTVADRHVVAELLRGEPVPAAREHTWRGDHGAIRLGVDGRGVPVSADIRGQFGDFRLLYQCFFERVPLPEPTCEALAATGRLELGRRQLARIEEDTVCTCMDVTGMQIRRVVRTHKPTMSALEELLGCGTVCGGCRPEVEALLVD